MVPQMEQKSEVKIKKPDPQLPGRMMDVTKTITAWVEDTSKTRLVNPDHTRLRRALDAAVPSHRRAHQCHAAWCARHRRYRAAALAV